MRKNNILKKNIFSFNNLELFMRKKMIHSILKFKCLKYKKKPDDSKVKTAFLNQIINETNETKQNYRNHLKNIIKVIII
jgi:hypothetical protein